MSFGGLSLESTICFPEEYRALNVWKNSSWVCSRPASDWMSSIRSTSVER